MSATVTNWRREALDKRYKERESGKKSALRYGAETAIFTVVFTVVVFILWKWVEIFFINPVRNLFKSYEENYNVEMERYLVRKQAKYLKNIESIQFSWLNRVLKGDGSKEDQETYNEWMKGNLFDRGLVYYSAVPADMKGKYLDTQYDICEQKGEWKEFLDALELATKEMARSHIDQLMERAGCNKTEDVLIEKLVKRTKVTTTVARFLIGHMDDKQKLLDEATRLGAYCERGISDQVVLTIFLDDSNGFIQMGYLPPLREEQIAHLDKIAKEPSQAPALRIFYFVFKGYITPEEAKGLFAEGMEKQDELKGEGLGEKEVMDGVQKYLDGRAAELQKKYFAKIFSSKEACVWNS